MLARDILVCRHMRLEIWLKRSDLRKRSNGSVREGHGMMHSTMLAPAPHLPPDSCLKVLCRNGQCRSSLFTSIFFSSTSKSYSRSFESKSNRGVGFALFSRIFKSKSNNGVGFAHFSTMDLDSSHNPSIERYGASQSRRKAQGPWNLPKLFPAKREIVVQYLAFDGDGNFYFW